MKYKQEFLESKNRKEFEEKIIQKYKMKLSSATRRFYDVQKALGIKKPVRVKVAKKSPIKLKSDEEINKDLDKEKETEAFISESSEFEKPSRLKIMMLQDMIRYKTPITLERLRKHGFKPKECNWVSEHINKVRQ